MGAGIAYEGRLENLVAELTLQGEPEGRVLQSLMNGDLVLEATPVPRAGPVLISLYNEATDTAWGHLFVGRATVSLAPLTAEQRRARRKHSGTGAVDQRPLSSLKSLRVRHRGEWLWELRNVHVGDIQMRDEPVQELHQ